MNVSWICMIRKSEISVVEAVQEGLNLKEKAIFNLKELEKWVVELAEVLLRLVRVEDIIYKNGKK